MAEKNPITDPDLVAWIEGAGRSPDDFRGNEGVSGKLPEADIIFPPPEQAPVQDKT